MRSIPFAKPFLPSMADYHRLLQGIWERVWLTNEGPLVQELEERLQTWLGVPGLRLVANGTLALQIALKSLPKGRIITTPYSYIATLSAPLWQGFEPVFADVSPDDYNIDPAGIEQCMGPGVVAILATHVYGNPCNVEAIGRIAAGAGIPVVYDAAHCFGTTYRGQSVFACGDAAIASLHATKLYHSTEGGFVATPHEALERHTFFARNFGHNGPGEFQGVGINAKMSELHAAMGLANLDRIDEILAHRRRLWDAYHERLKGAGLWTLTLRDADGFNGAYFPVGFANEQALLHAVARMDTAGILTRRYFHPALHAVLPKISRYPTQPALPVAEHAAATTLCLPMYHGMSDEDVDYVCEVLLP